MNYPRTTSSGRRQWPPTTLHGLVQCEGSCFPCPGLGKSSQYNLSTWKKTGRFRVLSGVRVPCIFTSASNLTRGVAGYAGSSQGRVNRPCDETQLMGGASRLGLKIRHRTDTMVNAIIEDEMIGGEFSTIFWCCSQSVKSIIHPRVIVCRAGLVDIIISYEKKGSAFL